jgi:hypothetical protein
LDEYLSIESSGWHMSIHVPEEEIAMKKALYISLVLLIALAVPLGTAIAGPAPKVDVCHLDRDSGTYILINISQNAFQAHADHGDGSPGDAVLGMVGMEFAEDCSVVPIGVSGTWRGESGYAGTMGYWFYMYLVQSPAGVVTGTVNYDIGIVRTVTGTVAGNAFTFVTHDNPSDPTQHYWADCTPCTVSLSGSYFHGYGTSSSSQNIEWEASRP